MIQPSTYATKALLTLSEKQSFEDIIHTLQYSKKAKIVKVTFLPTLVIVLLSFSDNSQLKITKYENSLGNEKISYKVIE